MICVSGASGTLSSEVLRQLDGQATPFRGAYFSESAEERRAMKTSRSLVLVQRTRRPGLVRKSARARR